MPPRVVSNDCEHSYAQFEELESFARFGARQESAARSLRRALSGADARLPDRVA